MCISSAEYGAEFCSKKMEVQYVVVLLVDDNLKSTSNCFRVEETLQHFLNIQLKPIIMKSLLTVYQVTMSSYYTVSICMSPMVK